MLYSRLENTWCSKEGMLEAEGRFTDLISLWSIEGSISPYRRFIRARLSSLKFHIWDLKWQTRPVMRNNGEEDVVGGGYVTHSG